MRSLQSDDQKISGFSGFTLLELLWIMFILTILLSTTIPHLSGTLYQMGLEKKAREIFYALTYSQQQAINKGEYAGLFFDLTEGQQEIICYQQREYDDGEPVIDSNTVVLSPFTKRPYLVKVSQEESSGKIRIAEASFGGNHWVIFDAMGVPRQAGQIILSGGNNSHTIQVSRIGRITLQ